MERTTRLMRWLVPPIIAGAIIAAAVLLVGRYEPLSTRAPIYGPPGSTFTYAIDTWTGELVIIRASAATEEELTAMEDTSQRDRDPFKVLPHAK